MNEISTSTAAQHPGGVPSNPQGAATGGAPRRKSVLALVTALVGGNVFATAIKLICGVVTARVIDPAVLGLFNGIGLILGYIPFLQLGVMNGLNRELPYHAGRGDHQHVKELAAVAQAWALLLGTGVALVLTGVAAWNALHGRWMPAAGWLTYAALGFILFYGTSYLQVTFRTRSDFARLALVNVVQSMVSLALIVLVWWLAFYGLCVRAVLVGLAQLALLWYWRPVKVAPAWRPGPFAKLVKTGLPIFATGQLYAYWGTLQATLVLYYMGTRGLGLFSLATMASGTMQMLPMALSQVLYPQMAEKYGRSPDLRMIVKSSLKPMGFAFLAVSLFTAAAWFLVPFVVKMLVPKYVDGIAAIQWALLVAPLMCFQPINNVFNVVKRQDLFAVAILLGIAVFYGTLRWLLRGGLNLTAFAQAMLAGKAVFILMCYAGVGWLIHKDSGTRSIATGADWNPMSPFDAPS